MISSLNKNQLFSTFGANDLETLKIRMLEMAPSMVEYYLCGMSQVDEPSYLNRRNIQDTINLGEYNIHIDYNEELFLEFLNNGDIEETGSLW